MIILFFWAGVGLGWLLTKEPTNAVAIIVFTSVVLVFYAGADRR